MKRTPLKRRMPLRAKSRLQPKRSTPKRRRSEARREQVRRDAEWARGVKERDGWRCQVTGVHYGPGSGRASRGLEAAHIFSRNNPYVRHDMDNGVSLSYRIHRFWAHRQPVEFAEWVKRWMGEERFESLRRRAFQGGMQLGLDKIRQGTQAVHGR